MVSHGTAAVMNAFFTIYMILVIPVAILSTSPICVPGIVIHIVLTIWMIYEMPPFIITFNNNELLQAINQRNQKINEQETEIKTLKEGT